MREPSKDSSYQQMAERAGGLPLGNAQKRLFRGRAWRCATNWRQYLEDKTKSP